MMDKYENHYTPDINTLLSDAESLLECVNFIEDSYIVGGESFLNRKNSIFCLIICLMGSMVIRSVAFVS